MRIAPTVSTRGAVRDRYALITPENYVENRLPGLVDVIARPLATPRFCGAHFGQYLLDLGPQAHTTRPIGEGLENFLFQVSGAAEVESADFRAELSEGDFVYLPPGLAFSVKVNGPGPSVMLWTKRPYDSVEGFPLPALAQGNRSQMTSIEPPPPGSYTYQELLPCADPSHDMAMNVLTAPPGGSIGLVEIHHQEHGLLMLEGQGIYYLAGDYHQVLKGDYIYMAPYCPQSFWATGSGAAYLLYKDVNRDGF